ncbi:hypothetical protein M0R45_005014 [Rubus argutus]|uniref:Uncharacterized protein n=1 Tax=Rubus argutus TaxID=59490 RepID=A0AAW1YLJ4_RUBAR
MEVSSDYRTIFRSHSGNTPCTTLHSTGGPPTITGEDILKSIWQVDMGYSKWVDLAILFGMVIVYRLMFLGIIKTSEKVVPIFKALLVGFPKHSEQVTVNPSS